VLVFTHAPPQSVSPLGQLHVPPEHVSEPVQACPHEPQLPLSRETSTQFEPHIMLGGEHTVGQLVALAAHEAPVQLPS
jgi:hypothetical protein